MDICFDDCATPTIVQAILDHDELIMREVMTDRLRGELIGRLFAEGRGAGRPCGERPSGSRLDGYPDEMNDVYAGFPDFAALIEDECERRENRAREAEFNRMSTLVSALDEKGGLELLPPAMQDRSHLEKLMDEYGI